MEDILLTNPPVGDILRSEFLEELDISVSNLADNLSVPYSIIQGIIQNDFPLTAEIDLRLCRYFGLSAGYFLRMQNAYDLMEAKRKLGETLNQIIPYSPFFVSKT